MPLGFLVGNSTLRWSALTSDPRRVESHTLSWEDFEGPEAVNRAVEVIRDIVDARAGGGMVIGSVRDDLLEVLLGAIARCRDAAASGSRKTPVVARRDFEIPIPNRYEPPEDVGTDRLLNALAARDLFSGETAIVVDFGTALSLSVVSPHGEFVGGPIAVGARTARQALERDTPALPKVKPRRGDACLQTSTEAALSTGLHRQFVGGVRELLHSLLEDVPTPAHVIATGGEAELFASDLPEIELVDSELTMRGLAIAARSQNFDG